MAVDKTPPDPLQSPTWDAMAERYLSGYPIVFDPNIKVGLPPVTQDQTQVPISIDARKLGSVDEIVVLGDLNPFPLTLTVRPQKTPAYFAFRMRVEQGTVIRAAARKDGVWRVGSRYLDAAGGGCSAPPAKDSIVDWDHLGQIRAALWREGPDTLRLRLRILHPMDTGLQKEPAFFIQSLQVHDAAGKLLTDLDVKEPIASNPTMTLLMADPKSGDHVAITAKDTDGHSFQAKVPMLHIASMTPIREGRL